MCVCAHTRAHVCVCAHMHGKKNPQVVSEWLWQIFLGTKPTLACFSLYTYESCPRLLREEHLLISIIIYRIVKIEKKRKISIVPEAVKAVVVMWNAAQMHLKKWQQLQICLFSWVVSERQLPRYTVQTQKEKLLGSEGLFYFKSELILQLFPTKRSSGGLVITSLSTLIYHQNERSAH